jgi:zinc finger protein
MAASSSDEQDMYRNIGSIAEGVAASSSSAAEEREGDDVEDSRAELEESASRLAATAGIEVVPDSLCVECGGMGVTRMLPTRIPFFREVIISSFSCPECGHRSSDVLMSRTQERGCSFALQVVSPVDLQRQLIKSDKASITVPALDLEIPNTTMSGVFTTVEGVLSNVKEDLERSQGERRLVDPAVAVQVDAFIDRLAMFLQGDPSVLPFQFKLDDPSGNSFIENPQAPKPDPHMRVTFYYRTREQNEFCGLNPDMDAAEEATAEAGKGSADSSMLVGSSATTTVDAGPHKSGGLIPDEATDAVRTTVASAGSAGMEAAQEVYRFDSPCPNCGLTAQNRMCLTNIPHFKQITLMALVCPHCDFKDVEIKGGGAIPAKGTVHTLMVDPETAAEDLRRDLLKGDSAGLVIPELDIEMEPGSLGGIYTTVEGLLETMRERIVASNPLQNAVGDSAGDEDTAERFQRFLERMRDAAQGRIAFTIIMKDPLANSWIYSPWDDAPTEEGGAELAATAGDRGAHIPEESEPANEHGEMEKSAAATGRDPRLRVEWYQRTEQEDVEHGIADMRVSEFPSE